MVANDEGVGYFAIGALKGRPPVVVLLPLHIPDLFQELQEGLTQGITIVMTAIV